MKNGTGPNQGGWNWWRFLVCLSQILTGRSAVAASKTAVEGLPCVAVHQLIHATSGKGYDEERPMTPSQKSAMPPDKPEQPAALISTIDLLERFKQGDEEAVGMLVERSLPPLKRWARGRLPMWARSLADTQDLVQDAVIRALPHLKTFEARHPGALQAYLRRAIANHIRDEIRKVNARPAPADLPDNHPDNGPSPLEQAIGKEGLARYEAALERLKPSEQEAIVARLELQQSYEEMAIALGKPTAEAARMAVMRAVKSLIKAMDEADRVPSALAQAQKTDP